MEITFNPLIAAEADAVRRFLTPGDVQARVDDSPLGPATSLRQVIVIGVSTIRFVDGVTAAGRWGGAYTHGAILVTGGKR